VIEMGCGSVLIEVIILRLTMYSAMIYIIISTVIVKGGSYEKR